MQSLFKGREPFYIAKPIQRERATLHCKAYSKGESHSTLQSLFKGREPLYIAKPIQRERATLHCKAYSKGESHSTLQSLYKGREPFYIAKPIQRETATLHCKAYSYGESHSVSYSQSLTFVTNLSEWKIRKAKFGIRRTTATILPCQGLIVATASNLPILNSCSPRRHQQLG